MKEKIVTETYDIVPWLYMVRRDFIIQNRLTFAEGYYYEDQLYTMQLLSCDGSALKIRFPYYFYRMDRPESTTNAISLKKATDAAYICEQMLAQLNGAPKEKLPYLQAICLMSLYQYYRVYMRLQPVDRKTAWRQFDFERAVRRVQGCGYYENLCSTLTEFVHHRYFHTLQRDVLLYLRKIKRRLLNK